MRQRSEAAPWAVRKAIDFITAHARRDISVGEVAAAAGTSLRTLQQNFQRSLKLSPQDYIKTVRLQGAHLELLDPASLRSIEEIATDWGFVNRGHFATQYRKAFGQLPSQTRRSR
jgi:transcriptional regulator GlxA family with amidase domain